MEKKFYMITINKDGRLFANAYEDKTEFEKSAKSFSEKYPSKLWELTATESNNYDLVIAKIKNRLLVCLGAKEKFTDQNLFRCLKKEIKI